MPDHPEPTIAEISIALYERDPPAGWVTVSQARPVDGVAGADRIMFEGWLGLLHVLAGMMGGGNQPTGA